MRFFSKLVFICNLCFIATVILRYVELQQKKQSGDSLVQLPFVQNIVVILGYSAVVLNLLFLVLLLFSIARKNNRVATWLIVFNLLIFVWQLLFHFNLY